MSVKMKGPHNTGGLSHAGEVYEADANGFVEVPNEAVGDAMSHGFVIQTADAAGEGAAGTEANLAAMTAKQLVAFGKDGFGLDLDPSLKKKDLIAAIEEAMAKQENAADAAGEGAAA